MKDELTEKELLLLQRKDKWNREKLDNLQSEIDDLTERVNEAESLNIKGNKYDNRRFKQMVKRKQQQLIESNRLKIQQLLMRKLKIF